LGGEKKRLLITKGKWIQYKEGKKGDINPVKKRYWGGEKGGLRKDFRRSQRRVGNLHKEKEKVKVFWKKEKGLVGKKGKKKLQISLAASREQNGTQEDQYERGKGRTRTSSCLKENRKEKGGPK